MLSGHRVPSVTAHHLPEHIPEAGGHEVVQDGVGRGTEVEEDAGDDVDILEHRQVVTGPVADKTPHQTVGVEGRPADPKHYN